MSSSDGGPTPTGGSAGQSAAMAEVQLTMAQAQRAMAEALLALSKGIVQPDLRTTDVPDDDGIFMHSGILDPSSSELTFLDILGPTESLESLADRKKRIRLEFALGTAPEYAARSETEKAVFLALGQFLAERAATLILMKSTCECENVRAPRDSTKGLPVPAPAPTPQPSPPAPPPDKG